MLEGKIWKSKYESQNSECKLGNEKDAVKTLSNVFEWMQNLH